MEELRSNRLQYIFDWVEDESPDLGGMSFDQAYEASREWHGRARDRISAARIKRLKREGKWFECPGGIHPVPGKILYTFDNGWTIREMLTFEELQNEGNMGYGGGCLTHCIGDTSSNYYGMIQRGSSRALSLRDPKNRPMVTIFVDASSSSIKQAKGLRNRLAGAYFGSGDEKGILKHLDDDYASIDVYLDMEATMLDEGMKKLGIRPASDWSKVARRLRDIEDRKRKMRGAGAANRGTRPHSQRRR